MRERIYWIDWMKVIGIYLIIAGHFMPPHYDAIYVFSVQIFLILSGFLSHPQSDKAFFKTIVRNLAVPMVILSVINIAVNCLLYPEEILPGKTAASTALYEFAGIFWGFQPSLGACWFIYTLIVIKLIDRYTPKRFIPIVLAADLCLLIAYNHAGLSWANALVNTLICYPVYMIGQWLRRYESTLKGEIAPKYLIGIFAVCLAIVYVCKKFNGAPWMFQNQYASSLVLFLAGSVAGTGCVFCFSKLVDEHCRRLVVTLADGSILAVGLHFMLIRNLFDYDLNYLYYLISIIVLLLFYPLTQLSKRYFPVLLGSRGKRVERVR